MKNYYLYIILWAGGCLIAATITVLWSIADKPPDTILFGNEIIIVNSGGGSSNIVNELLLSAKDLNISGSTLISQGYKRDANDGQLIKGLKEENKEQIYNSILKRKLDKVSYRSSAVDFSIKPVPEKNHE